MASAAQTLYLIDGHAQLYRAYHAVQARMFAADRKTPTNAVFGFAGMMRTPAQPLQTRICWPRSSIRTVRSSARSSTRSTPTSSARPSAVTKRSATPCPMTSARRSTWRFELVRPLYGVPAIQMDGYEADDVLGTLATKAAAQGINAVIVTGDKDLLQLVCDGIQIFDPMKDITFDAETVELVKGVKPCQIIDWLGFMGDSSDNIPGVAGVGEQTAVKLLQAHGSMDKAIEFYREKFKPQESLRSLDFRRDSREGIGEGKGRTQASQAAQGRQSRRRVSFFAQKRARAGFSRELATLADRSADWRSIPGEIPLQAAGSRTPRAAAQTAGVPNLPARSRSRKRSSSSKPKRKPRRRRRKRNSKRTTRSSTMRSNSPRSQSSLHQAETHRHQRTRVRPARPRTKLTCWASRFRGRRTRLTIFP